MQTKRIVAIGLALALLAVASGGMAQGGNQSGNGTSSGRGDPWTAIDELDARLDGVSGETQNLVGAFDAFMPAADARLDQVLIGLMEASETLGGHSSAIDLHESLVGGLLASVEAHAAKVAALEAKVVSLEGHVGGGSGNVAAVDVFLKLDGIEGESKDVGHKDEIEIESWSWGETNVASTSTGGAGAGKVNVQDISFTKKYDKSSPKLFLACASGEHIKTATITVRKAGGGQQEYLVIKLTDLLVSRYQAGGSSGVPVPTEEVSLSFAKVEFEYKEQRPDGSFGSPVKAGWDVAANKKI